MKKLVVLMSIIACAIAANAASFKWTAANIYGPDGNKYSGTASLFADGIDGALYTATVTAGAINATAGTFETTKTTVGEYYDFYFVIESDGKAFTSAKVNAITQATSTQAIGFGNMATATQAAGAWGTVPEPTSALLMVLGVAGLALRRRRV